MTKNLKETDFYYTVDKSERTEIKIKGSKFIASVKPVQSKEEAMDFLAQIRAEFHDANHNCFAYTIGYDGLEYRYADDGEPTGTAGKPILFSIKKFNIKDVIVIVTRYFGGTKLGVGGLARAYAESAKTALEMCTLKIVHRTIPVTVFCTYEDISPIKKLLDDFAISYEETYRDVIEIIARIPISKTEQFSAAVTSATKGRAGTLLRE